MPDLDSVDVDAITARLEDGVLIVTIPIKKREDKLNVKNIEISIWIVSYQMVMKLHRCFSSSEVMPMQKAKAKS